MAIEAPTALDIALGDATTVPETQAWGLFQTLRTMPADSPDFAPARAQLESYVTERRQYGRPVFPTYARQANKAREDYLSGLFTQPLEKVLPPESLAELDKRASFHPDPEAFKQRAVNRTFITALAGREIPADQFDFVRTAYAKQSLGLTDDTSDKAVYSAIQQRFTEDDATNTTLLDLSKSAFAATLAGAPVADSAAAIAALPERSREAATRQFQTNVREARRVKRKLSPAVDEIVTGISTKLDDILNDEGQTAVAAAGGLPLSSPSEGIDLSAELAKLPEDRHERQLAMAMITTRLQALPAPQKGAFERTIQSANRGVGSVYRDAEDLVGNATIEGVTAARDLIDPTGDDSGREVGKLEDYATARQDMREFMRMFQGASDPLHRASDNFLQKGGILAAGSAWTIPATLMGPAGFVAMATGMGGTSFMNARATDPEGNARLQLGAGAVSGPAQAFVEIAVNKLGFKAILGKMPGLAGVMNKLGISSNLARGAAGGAVALGTMGATEYAEEAVQGGIDRGLQDLALEFSNIAPTTNWKQFWGDWATVAGQEQQDTLLAVMPYALIGAGGASFSHFKYGKALSQNKTLLRAVGVPEEKIQEITRATDVAAADKAMQEAFTAGLEARTAEQRTAALGILRDQNALLEKAGIPRVTKEANSFTDEELHVFTDPITAERVEFPTEDEALEHWRNYALNAREEEIDTITEAARVGAVDFLTGEGMASEGTRVEDVSVTMTPERAIKAGIITPEQLASRVEIFVLQKGLTPQQAATEAGNLTIKARRFSEQARDGQFRYAVQLFRGANVMDVFEDLSEDSFARALDAGFADGEILLDDIRRFEDATGQTLIPAAYQYDSGNRLALLEALSKLSRAHLLGNVRADTLPPEIAKWVELNTTIYSQTLLGAQNISADINRAGVLKDAIKSGNVSPRLERLIADSIGINSAALEQRLTKKMEEQLAAEAMGGFPEIGEEARGMIPHPDTMQAKQHPLAGEVRRLWESLKKPTRRKTKDGKAIDRTNEANAFFLPVGEFEDLDKIRERLNQKGFEFDTPADLLDALDTSLSYGKPVYGTNSQGIVDSSFSVVSFQTALLDKIGEDALRLEQPKAKYEESSSFALSPSGINRIEAAIAKRMTQGPDERAAFFERVRNNLASLTLRLQDMDAGIGPFARKESDPVGEERRRIQDAIAEARAIISALPIETRGRVNLDFADITGATSERGRINALIRLLEKADDALEITLKAEYFDSFERLLDLAKPDLRQNKSMRGRLTPETQRLVTQIANVVSLTPVETAVKLKGITAQIEEMEANPPDPFDQDAIDTAQAALIQLQLDQHFLETFASLSTHTAGEIAHAFQELLTVYTRGRTSRQILDEAKREEMTAAKREVVDSLPRVTQATWSKHTEDKGLLDLLESGRLSLSSFHQVMEKLFPNSQVARQKQKEIRAADRAFVRAKIDARQRFEEFMRSAFNLEGIGARRKWNKILAKLSTRRDDWNIELKEGIKSEKEKMTEEQAAAILDGTLKPGWETDPIAMESLRQALLDFRMQRLKAKNEEKAFSAKVIRFSRITSRGAPSWLHISDMEAVYLLQLAAQDQYLPALDKYGFTAPVLDAIRAKLDPQAATMGTFLRKEYDSEYARLNPVFRTLYGLDMPRIRNYAPGLFDHLDGKTDTNAMDAYGNPATPVNAMSAGFTKARTHHMARPRQMNAMGAFWAHLEATEYFIAYAETMRDMRQIFRNPEVRRSLEGNYGTRTAGIFSTWLDALEVDGKFRAANVAGLQEMTANTLASQSAIGLAYNLGVLFKQFSAATGVFMEMKTTDAIRGVIGSLRDPSTLKHVWGKESIQQRILGGMNPEDKRLLDAANASPSLVMELLDIGRMPIAWADAAFTTLAGSIAYNHHLQAAKKAGLSDRRAEEVALEAMDRVITRTAQPATTQDKSLAENTANGFGRFLFLFKSDPRQKFAISAAAVRDLQSGKIGKAEAGRRLFWGWAVYGLLGEVMTDIWAGISKDNDDEDRWAVSDYVAAMVAGPVAGIPLIGSALSYVATSTIGTKAFSNSTNPLDNAANRLFKDGFTSATWKAITAGDELTVSDILNGALRDTSAIAQIAGAIDSRAAIVPAAIRAVRDVAGVAANATELVFGESAEDQARKIIDAERKTDKGTSTTRSEEITRLTKELAPLTPEARAARLRPLDKDLAKAVETKLRKNQMTASERALSTLGKDARARAIEKITAAMDDTRKTAYLARLKSLGID